jgi:hypothetical protein
MTLATELDTWAGTVATHTGLVVTRDPDLIHPPCLFVGLPEIESATLNGVVMRLPVWLVSPGGGKPAGDILLDNVMAVIRLDEFADTATDQTLTVAGIDYHTYLLTARIYTTP